MALKEQRDDGYREKLFSATITIFLRGEKVKVECTGLIQFNYQDAEVIYFYIHCHES